MSGPAVGVVGAAQLREIIIAAAEVCVRTATQPLDASRKHDGTLVTRVDMAVNDWLRPALEALLPSASWLSEESEHDPSRLSAEWIWIVDPLDGTKELVRGIPECAVSVGLVTGGQVRAGAVVNPFTGLWAAAGTDGSWCQSTAHTEAADGVTSVSRTETEDASIAPFLDLLAPSRSVGSVAYKLLRVATGIDRMTVSVQPKSEWDVCGGAALLQARGGVFLRLDGEPLRFNQASTRIASGFVAGPFNGATELHARFRSRFPSGDRMINGGGI